MRGGSERGERRQRGRREEEKREGIEIGERDMDVIIIITANNLLIAGQ